MPDWTERYRRDGHRTCIDIRLKSVEQLFDNRDPAPFHDRDLDEDAASYLLEGASEIPASSGPLAVVVWLNAQLPRGLTVEQVHNAFTTHFESARRTLDLRIRKQRSIAVRFTLVAFVALFVLLGLAELTSGLRTSAGGHIVPEGLTILAWVVMWRPLETLLFDWWPLAQDRKLLARVAAASVEVHVGLDPNTAVPAAGSDPLGKLAASDPRA